MTLEERRADGMAHAAALEAAMRRDMDSLMLAALESMLPGPEPTAAERAEDVRLRNLRGCLDLERRLAEREGDGL